MHKNQLFKTLTVIILLCSCINLIHSQDINHWEMVVAADDTWQYFSGNSEPPSNWSAKDFDAGTWLSGQGGIGYGDGDDGTTISAVSSVFLRKVFNLSDISIISWAVLHVDYDDAFVAYLNGHEIARANIGVIGLPPAYNSYATETHEALMYNGGIPDRFIIHKDTMAKYMIDGDNVLAVQVHNSDAGSSDMSSNIFLSAGITDASTTYRAVPSWFNDPLNEVLNLPIVIIDTRGQTIVDEPKILAWLKIINNGSGQMNNYFDDATDYDGLIGIEIRGQSSQMFPKKSFSIETRDEAGDGVNVSLLGMPAEEDWVLYAPYSDKTMLRNAITYQLGRKMGNWQPGYKFCEVYLNGSYHGIYMLIEKIKRGSDRVDINKLKPDEISGDDLTGGYIIKVDKTWDLTTDEYFYTYPSATYNNARNYAFTYDYPKFDDIVAEQKNYIYDYLVTLENTLNGPSFKDPENGFRNYMDINSFIDFQIINELANNVDGYRYSTFFYKKKDSDGGKLFAGPLWDFDLSYGNVDYSPSNLATNQWLYPNYGPDENYPMHWWARMMEDPEYHGKFAERWNELRAGPFKTDSIMTYLDDNIQHLGSSVARNFERWPILGQYIWPNNYVGSTYQQEVDYLKNWITDRLIWMDANVSAASSVTNFGNTNDNTSVYPNPAIGKMNIALSLNKINKIGIEIIDLLGKQVFDIIYTPTAIGKQTIHFNIPKLTSGYYMLKIKQNGNLLNTQKIIINN